MIYFEREPNQEAYYKLRAPIAQSFPKGWFVAIHDGHLVANAETFDLLLASLKKLDIDPRKSLVAKAGVSYLIMLTFSCRRNCSQFSAQRSCSYKTGASVITYKAMYKYLDDGVHAEVLDFPGAISCGKDLAEARRMLASSLVDMAETNILLGEALPRPNPAATDAEADIEEPIYLLLQGATRVSVQPQAVSA